MSNNHQLSHREELKHQNQQKDKHPTVQIKLKQLVILIGLQPS